MKRNDKHKKSKSAVGGLVGRSIGGRIKDSHFKGEIKINGNPEDIDIGGLVGQSENTEIMNSSADAEIKFADKIHQSEPIIEIKPNLYGISVNLRVLAKKVRTFFYNRSHL